MAPAKQKETDGTQGDTAESQPGGGARGTPAGSEPEAQRTSGVSGNTERQADAESHGEAEIRHMVSTLVLEWVWSIT